MIKDIYKLGLHQSIYVDDFVILRVPEGYSHLMCLHI